MKRIYKYGNAVVTIIFADTSESIIRKATPVFLKNVVKERKQKCVRTK